MSRLQNSKPVTEVMTTEYDVIYFPGGEQFYHEMLNQKRVTVTHAAAWPPAFPCAACACIGLTGMLEWCMQATAQ